MKLYRVTWVITIAAETAKDAERFAKEMQRDGNMIGVTMVVETLGEAPQITPPLIVHPSSTDADTPF